MNKDHQPTVFGKMNAPRFYKVEYLTFADPPDFKTDVRNIFFMIKFLL